MQTDVSKEDDVERIFTQVIDEFNGLDILINNAGIQISGASDEIEVKDFDRVWLLICGELTYALEN